MTVIVFRVDKLIGTAQYCRLNQHHKLHFPKWSHSWMNCKVQLESHGNFSGTGAAGISYNIQVLRMSDNNVQYFLEHFWSALDLLKCVSEVVIRTTLYCWRSLQPSCQTVRTDSDANVSSMLTVIMPFQEHSFAHVINSGLIFLSLLLSCWRLRREDPL